MARHPRLTLVVCVILGVQGLLANSAAVQLLCVVAAAIVGGISTGPRSPLARGRGSRFLWPASLVSGAVTLVLFVTPGLSTWPYGVSWYFAPHEFVEFWALAAATVLAVTLGARVGGPRSAPGYAVIAALALAECAPVMATFEPSSGFGLEWGAGIDSPSLIATGSLTILATRRRSCVLNVICALLLGYPDLYQFQVPWEAMGLVFACVLAGRAATALHLSEAALRERAVHLSIAAQRRPWRTAAVGVIATEIARGAWDAAITVPYEYELERLEDVFSTASLQWPHGHLFVACPEPVWLGTCVLFVFSWRASRAFDRVAPWVTVTVWWTLITFVWWSGARAVGWAPGLQPDFLAVPPFRLAPLAVGLAVARGPALRRFGWVEVVLIALIAVGAPLVTCWLADAWGDWDDFWRSDAVGVGFCVLNAALAFRLAGTTVRASSVVAGALTVAMTVAGLLAYMSGLDGQLLGILTLALPSALVFAVCVELCRTFRSVTAIPPDHPVMEIRG